MDDSALCTVDINGLDKVNSTRRIYNFALVIW